MNVWRQTGVLSKLLRQISTEGSAKQMNLCKVYPQQLMQPRILLHTGYHTDLIFSNALLTASTPFVQKQILVNDGLLAATTRNAAIEAQRCETFQDLIIQLVAKQSSNYISSFLSSNLSTSLSPFKNLFLFSELIEPKAPLLAHAC